MDPNEQPEDDDQDEQPDQDDQGYDELGAYWDFD